LFPKTQAGLEVVGNFWYSYEAHLAKALLVSEGLEAWVLDEHHVSLRWHFAAALGGIKVAVLAADAARARALLAEDRSEALEGISEQSLPAGGEERCPACGGESTSTTRSLVMPTLWQWLQSLFFLAFGLLVPRRRVRFQHRCECGHSWSELK
jgi:hypothetical protein